MGENGSILGSMKGGEVDPDMQNAPGPNPFEANAAMLDDFGKKSALANQDATPFDKLVQSGAVKKITYDQNGLSLSGLDPRLVVGMMEKSKRLDMIMGAMQQEGQRLQTQREQLDSTGGRIGNAVSVFAGNLASQRDMPGWVQAAGRTALELNPTRQQLTAQQMKLGEEEAKIGESQQRLMEARMRAEEIKAYREAETQRKREADDAREEAKKRDLEIKGMTEEDRRQAIKNRDAQEREKIVEKEKARLKDEVKISGGRAFTREVLAKNPKLDEGAVSEVLAFQKGVMDENAHKDAVKKNLQSARLDARKAFGDASNTTKTAIANIGKMNQSAKEGELAKVAAQIQKAEEAHAMHAMAVQDNIMTDDTKKLENMKLFKESEKALDELKAQYEILKKKAQPSGPTMSAPGAAAPAAGPKKLTYNPTTGEFE